MIEPRLDVSPPGVSALNADQFVQRFRQARVSAILRTADRDQARLAMEAAIAGGLRIVEFTLSIPGATELIAEFSCRGDVVVGAGTVLTVEQARETVRAGASFLVSPVVDEQVIDEARSLGVAMMPGASSPTEMLRAYRAGAPLQKLFPAPGTGPAWVAQTLGPLPFLRIVPTSGVTPENAGDYLRAGAFAVGLVNSLFVPQEIEQGRFDQIQQRAAQVVQSLSQL
jgi:Entner-Doudoroff aldolase